MSKYGAEFPKTIDLLTSKDDVCILYIVQGMDLDDELTLKLQEKINNYLTYISEGQLEEENPDMVNMAKKIQINLQYEPEGIAAEFLEKVRPYIEAEGIEFQIQVGLDK